MKTNDIPFCVQNLRLTERLERSACRSLTLADVVLSDALVRWISSFPRLERLGLVRCGGVEKARLARLVRRILDANNEPWPAPAERSGGGGGGGRLIGLRLESCGLRDGHLKVLAEAMHGRLLELDISGNARVTDEGLDYLGQRCAALTHLVVDGLVLLRDGGLCGAMGATPGILPLHSRTLRTFSAAGCHRLTDAALQCLLTHVHDAQPPLSALLAQHGGGGSGASSSSAAPPRVKATRQLETLDISSAAPMDIRYQNYNLMLSCRFLPSC